LLFLHAGIFWLPNLLLKQAFLFGLLLSQVAFLKAAVSFSEWLFLWVACLCFPILGYFFLLCTALFLNHASSVPIFVLGRSSFEQSLPFSRRQPSGSSFAWQSLSGFFSQLLLRRATASRRECSFSCGVVFS